MPYTVKEIVNALDYDELLKIKKDLNSGGIHLKNLVEKKITEYQKEHAQACSVCSNELNPESTENYTLIFGPESFRKKATFCALDCLEYFLKDLKDIKGKR